MKMTSTTLLLLISIVCSCNTANSISGNQPADQQTPKHNTGKVIYQIDIDTDNEMIKTQFGQEAIVEFNSELLKFTKIGPENGFEFQLIDFKENKTWNYLNFLGEKFRIPDDASNAPIVGTPVYHDEYKTIAGFKCQKITAPMGDGEMVAYITKDINVNYCPYLELTGFAMLYQLALPFGEVTYTATQFEPTTPTLSIDNNYITYPSINAYRNASMEHMDDLVSQKMSNFEIKDSNGNQFTTDNLRDKITVFNFWFTSCAPCITEIPDLNELKLRYKNEPVQFWALTFDTAEDINPFLEKYPFDFKIFPNQKELINQLKIRTYPTTLVTDKSGNIIHSESGGSFSILEDLSAVIDSTLKKK